MTTSSAKLRWRKSSALGVKGELLM